MAYYALVASLPHLQIGGEPPFSAEEYIANCAQWVNKDEVRVLEKILQRKHQCGPCSYCKLWFDVKAQLRNAIAKQRAQRLGVDYKDYLQPHDGFSGTLEQMVSDAFTSDDPLVIEEELDRARWQMAEDFIKLNPFGFEKLLAYGIQLMIVERWNKMDVSEGKKRLEAVITANTETEETAAAEAAETAAEEPEKTVKAE